ncbi:MAG: MarR family winged helix-turn-helix transcriptional regulator [Candidatus Kryptoniota bacterium]
MKSAFNLDYQNSNVDTRIVAALERISEAFRVLLWEESKAFSLTPIQIQILIFLQTHSKDKHMVSYIAEEFNLTKPTISDAVRALEEKLLIKRKINPDDSRSHYIELTKRGKEIATRASLFTVELENPIKQLNPDDKERLLLSLLKIIYHLTRTGVITIQRMCLTCTYYRIDQDNGEHFCTLLNKKLQVADLRIDCPEHAFTLQSISETP